MALTCELDLTTLFEVVFRSQVNSLQIAISLFDLDRAPRLTRRPGGGGGGLALTRRTGGGGLALTRSRGGGWR